MNRHLEQLREYLAGRDVPCPECNYNLRDLKTSSCPECGLEVSEQSIKTQTMFARGQMITLVVYDSLFCLLGVFYLASSFMAGRWLPMRLTLLLGGTSLVLSGAVSILCVMRLRKLSAQHRDRAPHLVAMWLVGLALPWLLASASKFFIHFLNDHVSVFNLGGGP